MPKFKLKSDMITAFQWQSVKDYSLIQIEDTEFYGTVRYTATSGGVSNFNPGDYFIWLSPAQIGPPDLVMSPALFERLCLPHETEPPQVMIDLDEEPADRQIYKHLYDKLGSDEAVNAYLNSPDTGYLTTAREAINHGFAKEVLQHLKANDSASLQYG